MFNRDYDNVNANVSITTLKYFSDKCTNIICVADLQVQRKCLSQSNNESPKQRFLNMFGDA